MDGGETPTKDKSTVFQILLWFLLVVAMLSVGARLGTKYAMTRRLAWDDWLMLAAQSVYLAQCVSISLGASQGLGRQESSLSNDAINSFLKAEYASFIFQLITLALIKWSISAFIQQLSPNARNRRLVWLLRVVVGLWLISAVLMNLFQCALPTPWDYIDGHQCIDRRAWWTYVAVTNIATELCIVGLYFLIILNLQMSIAKRTAVLLIFSTRLLVIGIAVAQLILFLDSFPSSDITVDLWLPTVLNQAVLSASVVTACGPYLRPFMESLESGIVRVENLSGSEEDLSRERDRTGPSSDYYLSSYSHSATCSSSTTH